MKAQATPPQWHTRPNMAADLANVHTTVTAVSAAPPKGGKPTDGQVADWLRDYAERRDPSDRERIILAHLDLADRLAARYRDRPNTTPDDLRQTAWVGLIGAVDRYDPTRGTPLLANRLGLTHDEVTRAMQAAENRTALSLDVPVDSEDTTPWVPCCPIPSPRWRPRTCWCCPARSPPCPPPSEPPWSRTTSRAASSARSPWRSAARRWGVPSAAPGARAPA